MVVAATTVFYKTNCLNSVLQESHIQHLAEKICAIEQLLLKSATVAPVELGQEFGDWASATQIKKLTGLGDTTLLRLRKENAVTYSTIEGKGVWYRKSDFVKLLNKNELKRK